MQDKDKTQKQLIKELVQLRQRIAELEASERERKQVVEALKRSEQEKAAVFDSISEHVVYQDTRMRVLWANRAAGESVGVDPQQLVGRHCYEIWQQRRKPCVGCPVVKARKSGQPQEAEMTSPDGRVWFIRGYPVRGKKGSITGAVEVTLEITERKRAKQEHLAHLRFLENMDQFNRALQGTNDLDQMMSNALGVLLTIFDCDRAWLLYPCDPETTSWRVPMQRTQPEYPGTYPLGTEIPLVADAAKMMQIVLDSGAPVRFGSGLDYPLPEEGTKRFGIQSQLTMAIYPKVGKPWMFGLHQCSYVRVWMPQEEQLFQEIGHRLTDALTSLLLYRDLQESEEQFRQFFENEPEYCYMISPEGVILNVNKAVLNALGYKKEELVGKPLKTIYAPESLPKMEQLLEKWKKTGQLKDEELVIITKKGERRTVLLSAGIVKDADGKVLNSVSVQKDITERKRAEEKHQIIVKTALDGFWLSNLEGKILEVNDSYCKMIGYTREELVKMSIPDIEAIESPEEIAQHIKKIMAKGHDRFETRHKRKDGKIIDVEMSVNYLDVGGGQFFAFARDITERKRAEEELKESEEKFRNLAEQSPNMIFINAKGRVIYANKKCEEMGYKRKKLYDPTFDFFTLIAPESIDLVKERYGRHMKGEEVPPYEYTLITKKGKKIEAIISTKLIHYEGESAIIGTVTDITERKQIEEELQRSYKQLRETLMTTVNALTSMVEMKDRYTAGHQPRVAQLACAIAEEMKLSKEQIEGIRIAALVHDIGKVMIPAEILSKPGPLTDIQFDMVKMHSQAGYDILKGIKFPWPVAQIVLQHHERMDGSGYPDGLKDGKIMLEARILAVANVVEAMTAHRPYREAHNIKEALQKISQHKGVFYDPDAVNVCLKLFTKKRFTFD